MSRDEIFKNLNTNPPTKLDLRTLRATKYDDKQNLFIRSSKLAGAELFEIEKQMINKSIGEIFGDCKNIGTIYDFKIANINPNSIKDPKELDGVDLMIIKGEFGVAENGAIFINEEENIHHAVYTISKNLLIILDKKEIVDTMHEAYERIDKNSLKTALFISGPSKTADIEQVLVIGAHGAKRVVVFLI